METHRSRAGLANRLFATEPETAPLLLRLVLAGVMWPHGAQKLLGWFGGFGLEGSMGFFTETIGLPTPIGFLLILLEFLGPIMLVLGLGTRAVALAFVGLMAGAIQTVHLPHGFFMNWYGKQSGEGFEFHLLVIGIAAALVLTGSGRWSLDERIAG